MCKYTFDTKLHLYVFYQIILLTGPVLSSFPVFSRVDSVHWDGTEC